MANRKKKEDGKRDSEKERGRRAHRGVRVYTTTDIYGVHPFVLVITICALSDAARIRSAADVRAAVVSHCIANRTGLCRVLFNFTLSREQNTQPRANISSKS